MFKFLKKMKKNRKGYTLTELIVVVAILGILAAIGTPMVMNQIQNSREGADATTASAIETAVQLCLGNETLVMSDEDANVATPDTIGLGTGAAASILLTVEANMVGGAIQSPEQNNFEFYLNLLNGQVDCLINTTPTSATYIDLNP